MTRPIRTALSLSAGGARGAYQAGALKAIAERGWRFRAVAGSSIGAINGAFYVQGDGSADHLQRLIHIWQTAPQMKVIKVGGGGLLNILSFIFSRTIYAVPAFLMQLAIGRLSILDPEPLAKMLDAAVDYDRIRRGPLDLVVALAPEIAPLLDVAIASRRKATYVRARDLSVEDLRSALLAAAAIPFAFPSQKVSGRRYADAGLIDPLPETILHELGYRRMVSIALDPPSKPPPPDATVYRLTPLAPISTSYWSVFNTSRDAINAWIALGYQEASLACDEWGLARRSGVLPPPVIELGTETELPPVSPPPLILPGPEQGPKQG